MSRVLRVFTASVAALSFLVFAASPAGASAPPVAVAEFSGSLVRQADGDYHAHTCQEVRSESLNPAECQFQFRLAGTLDPNLICLTLELNGLLVQGSADYATTGRFGSLKQVPISGGGESVYHLEGSQVGLTDDGTGVFHIAIDLSPWCSQGRVGIPYFEGRVTLV